MSILLALILITILIVDRLIARISKNDIPWYLSPTVWLVTPWILCALVFSAPIIVHREEINVYHIFYISISVAAFVVGCNTLEFIRGRNSINLTLNQQIVSPKVRLLKRFFLLGMVGGIFIIYDNLAISGISLKDRLLGTGLSAARDFAFDSQIQGVRGPFFLLEPLSGFGLIFLLLYLHSRFSGAIPEGKKKLYFVFALMTVLMAVFNSLVISGGRMGIVLLFIVLGQMFLFDRRRTIIIWVKGKKLSSKFFLIGTLSALLLSAVVLLGTVYVQKRSNDQSPISSLYLGHRAELEPWLLAVTQNDDQIRYGLFTISYITTPLATLSLYLDLKENQMPGPFYGQYNFPGIADRIVKRIDKDSFVMWWDARLEVFAPLLRLGYGGNVWATLLRDLAADVGRPFVPFFMFLFGFLCRIAVVRAYRYSDPYWTAIGSALLCVALFSAFHSLLYILTVTNLLLLGGALIILEWFNSLWRRGAVSTLRYGKKPMAVHRGKNANAS